MKRGAGARSRAMLARTARFARAQGLVRTRAERFAAYPAAAQPTFAEIASWPAWPALEAAEQTDIFALTALLSARDALGEVICGSELRAYAGPFGHDLFERALTLEGSGARALPAPEALAGEGERLARCGLPPALAHCLGESIAGEPHAARHVSEAEGMLRP